MGSTGGVVVVRGTPHRSGIVLGSFSRTSSGGVPLTPIIGIGLSWLATGGSVWPTNQSFVSVCSLLTLEVTDMATLSIDRDPYDGAYGIDNLVTISAGTGNIVIVARAGGKVWQLKHLIMFSQDDYYPDGVPEWAFNRKMKLMNDIMRRGTINTDNWIEMTTPVHMTSRQPS